MSTQMPPETLAALRESIAHWQANVDAKTAGEVSVDSKDCALCNAFAFKDKVYNECIGCPVAERAGQTVCEGTPFYDARNAWSNWCRGDGTREAFRRAAQAELDFLKSLLPEGESP